MDRTRPAKGMKSRASYRLPYRHNPVFVIELLEEYPSRWLLEELRESYEFADSHGYRLIVSGVTNSVIASSLNRAGIPFTWGEGFQYNRYLCILLDLNAKKPLEPWEAAVSNYIIIGGIMGDHPPRGRTVLLSMGVFTNCSKRNLGKEQLSIDGALKTAVLIAEGLKLGDIDFVRNIRLTLDLGLGVSEHEVLLPYVYPSIEGEPLISKRLQQLLARGVLYDEEYLLTP
ncbi:MAG: hypothetical protein F7B20_02795 [Aeropyrum sp.]|nr:hypothetical protein [Aeropyrum sp.]MCE4615452.1 hypothetical protein [Aeropyrum sp.]